MTKETGATGVALCLAPPGYELKDGATTITACAAGSYKADWNRNPCVAVSYLMFDFTQGPQCLPQQQQQQ
jgi:hypothetical protein